jgi:hypothetical protein
MTDSNIDNALVYLGNSIKSLVDNNAKSTPLDITSIPEKLPKRSLSGDHINGGIIFGFASRGIKDEAEENQILIKNNNVHIKKISTDGILGNLSVEQSLTAQDITASGTIRAAKLEVNELTADLRVERSSSLEFKKVNDDSIFGKGLLWFGEGNVKQFVFNNKPDRFFSSEHIELFKDRTLIIGGVPILTATELGSSVVKSNLRELGRLRGLIVDGNVNIDQYVYYNSANNRLGLGTETPNAGLSVAEDGVEVVLGTKEQTRGMVGTYASMPFDIITDNTTRLSVSPSGNIQLGNTELEPIQVAIHGKLSIRVNNPDPNVDLHVNGPIRFHGRMHSYAEEFPSNGSHRVGDIVWNSSPDIGKPVGWVCVRAGAPGLWKRYGLVME